MAGYQMYISYVVDILIILLLGFIFKQDMRDREVSLWLFILTLPMFVIKYFILGNTYEWIFINAGFIIIQLLGVVSFSIIKLKKLNPFLQLFGFGDLFIWGILIFGFSPINFVVFFMFSLAVSLIFYQLKLKKKQQTIPLAGMQAMSYIIVLVVAMAFKEVNLYSDLLWIELIGNGYSY